MAACLVTLVMAGGCGDDPPSAPSDPYQGFWTGTIVDNAGGPGTLRVSLPGGSPLTGTWAATLGTASPIGVITVEATTGPQRALALACGTAGSVGLSATVNGTAMTGTYLAIGCGLSSGSIALSRR